MTKRLQEDLIKESRTVDRDKDGWEGRRKNKTAQ